MILLPFPTEHCRFRCYLSVLLLLLAVVMLLLLLMLVLEVLLLPLDSSTTAFACSTKIRSVAAGVANGAN